MKASPIVQLELFHETVPRLKGFEVGFEVLSGTLEQARTLVDAVNERIVGVIVTPRG
jgi:hypothetical protein